MGCRLRRIRATDVSGTCASSRVPLRWLVYMDVVRGLQEGWMEMPELFGNPYILPVVIVVVLLLALLLILMVGRRRAANGRSIAKAEGVGQMAPRTGPPETAPNEVSLESAASTGPNDGTAGITPQPSASARSAPPTETPSSVDLGPMVEPAPKDEPGGTGVQVAASEPPPPAVSPPKTKRPAERAALADDPLRAVVLDVVHGWGELTSEDTNRLDLFRSDKILVVAESIELPKEDKDGGYARARLLAIRKYAADKQTNRKPSEGTSPSASEPAVAIAEPRDVQVETDGTSAPGSGAGSGTEKARRPVWTSAGPTEAPAGAGTAAGAGLAALGLEAAAEASTDGGEPIEDHQSLEKALGDSGSEWAAPEALAPSPWLETLESPVSVLGESQPVVSGSEPRELEQLESGDLGSGETEPELADMPSPWSETPVDWDIQEPLTFEEVPVQSDMETPLVGTGPIAAAEAAGAATETAVGIDAAEGVEAVEGTEAPEGAETVHGFDAVHAVDAVGAQMPPSEDMTARVQALDDSLSTLHVRVRTAEELMAQPPDEQADMLAFLEPPELARVMQMTDDRELKKSVIDVLENLGSPASLNVLHGCLDDPDQEIQLYALDAADHLLGME